jgi:hypothetical protein
MAKGDKIPNRAGMNVREGLELLGWDFKVDIKRYPRLKGDELNKAREMKRFATTAATFGLANDNGTPFSGTVRSLLEPTSEPDKWRWSRQRFHVKVFFDFTRSRVDPDALSKPGLQGHEQGHFDLAQLAARDFCAELLDWSQGALPVWKDFPVRLRAAIRGYLMKWTNFTIPPLRLSTEAMRISKRFGKPGFSTTDLPGLTSRAWRKSPEDGLSWRNSPKKQTSAT